MKHHGIAGAFANLLWTVTSASLACFVVKFSSSMHSELLTILTQKVKPFFCYLLASLANSSSPLVTREKLYLLAVGHYRNGDYLRSRQLVDHCLQVFLTWCFLYLHLVVFFLPGADILCFSDIVDWAWLETGQNIEEGSWG
jgi:Fis1 C-terminal tetratricopeptide repeat